MRRKAPWLVTVTLALCATLGATEYFVSPQGGDTHSGRTRDQAFATIQRGLDALSPGDTLTIAPGDYRESVRRHALGGPDADTLIRAEIPGTARLRGDRPAPAFRRLEGARFVYVADFDPAATVPAVNELDSLTILRRMPSFAELEFTPGAFFHDGESGKLYLSTSDMAPVEQHRYSVSVIPTHGLYLSNARRVRIEGLTATGFNARELLGYREGSQGSVWGLFLANGKDCVIRNCRAWMNGWGIGLNSSASGSGDNIIERCLAWGNDCQFTSGDCGGISLFNARRDTVRHSVAFLNGMYGINIYGTGTDGGPYGANNVPGNDEPNKSRLADNLAWGNRTADFKIKTGVDYFHTVERCAGPGLWSVQAANLSRSLVGRNTKGTPPDTIVLSAEAPLDPAAEFADPDHHDYRLQATSRFRGTAPDGTDRGPHPYMTNVFYAAPTGSDDADGLSVLTAWKTFARAAGALKAGDTLYLLPGVYEANGVPVLAGSPAAPIAIRGRGLAPVVLRGNLALGACASVEFTRLGFEGRLEAADRPSVTFTACTLNGQSLRDPSSGARDELQGKPTTPSLRLVEGPRVHSLSATTANIEWTASLPSTCELAWGETTACTQTVSFDANRFGSYSLTGLRPGHTYHFVIRSLRIPEALHEQYGALESAPEAAMLSFATPGTNAAPATYTVAPDGDDRRSGRGRADAWRTLQHAADRVNAGDTVMIAGGRYPERVRIRATGSPEAPILFRCMPGEKVVLDGGGQALSHAFLVAGKSHLRFDGLYFKDFNLFPLQVWHLLESGEFSLYACRDIVITRCFSDGRGGYSARAVKARQVEDLRVENCVTINKMSGPMVFDRCPGLRIAHNVFVVPMISSFTLNNRPDQAALLEGNLFTDMLAKKAALNIPFAEIESFQSFRLRNNGFVLRSFPPQERLIFAEIDHARHAVIRQLTLPAFDRDVADTQTLFADPIFAGDPGPGQKPKGKGDFSPDRMTDPALALDFNSFFVTQPEMVRRGIGLQPEAFGDFRFTPTAATAEQGTVPGR